MRKVTVSHDTGDRDTEAAEVGNDGPQEGNCALLLLVGQDLGEGDPRCIVDGDVDKLPAGAPGLAQPSIAGDPVTDAVEARELLDVDVNQLAGVSPLVAANRLGGLERCQAIEAEALEDAADGGR